MTTFGPSLIHCVQHERGCSCAWVGSAGTLSEFGNLVRLHREEADAMIASRTHVHHPPGIVRRLQEIRAAVDRFDGSGSISQGENAAAFYHVFTSYNSIIAELLQDDEEWTAESFITKDRVALAAALAFANLKEEVGKERAFVCGVLSLPEGAHAHLPARAFADFVLCLHRQRAEQQAVRGAFDDLSSSLLHMLEAGFELSPQLGALQETLLLNFDVLALKKEGLTVRAWWHLITTHLNKLHLLQTLFAKELRRRHRSNMRLPESLPSPLLSSGFPSPCTSRHRSPSSQQRSPQVNRSASLSTSPTDRSNVPITRRPPPRKPPVATDRGALVPDTLFPDEMVPSPPIDRPSATKKRLARASRDIQLHAEADLAALLRSAPPELIQALAAMPPQQIKSVMLEQQAILEQPEAPWAAPITVPVADGEATTTKDYGIRALPGGLVEQRGSGLQAPPGLSALSDAVTREERLSDEAVELGDGGDSGRQWEPVPVQHDDNESGEDGDAMLIELDELRLSTRIGTGGFSTAYIASWTEKASARLRSSGCGAEQDQPVAIKVASSVGGSFEQWRAEVRSLARLSHVNVVRFYGYVASPPIHSLVLQYCDGGECATLE